MNDSTSPAPENDSQERENGSTTGRLATTMRKPWFRTVVSASIAIAAIAAGVFIYVNRPIPVQVALVEKNVPVRVFGLGTVEARILSKIGFEVGATLVELGVDHGDRVTKGQVLARLNAGEQEARVAMARASLQIAQVNILRAEANLEKAGAVLAQKQEANRRTQALVERDVVSQQLAEETARDEAVAKADVAVAESEVESAKAQAEDARAKLQFEETMLRHRTLRAPYDGLIIQRHTEPGTVVKLGDPIYTLISAGSYWGLAYVDEARAGFIREGQRVDARLRSRPQDAFTGRVARIGLESDRVTEERRVFIAGDNPPPRIYLGEQVEFWITVAQLETAVLVPEASVQGYDGRQGWIWTVESGRLRHRLVGFNHRTEDARLEISEGLPEGVQAVVRLEDGFREGRSVHVVEDEVQ